MDKLSDQPILKCFADDGIFPNSRLPVLIYRAAMARRDASPAAMEALFEQHGWPPQWQASIFTYHHYHSTAHECLGIAAGEATLLLGGPHGQEVHVTPGHVIVIPAGVAHKRITASADFLVVGAYPAGGEKWDLLRGTAGDRPKADDNIGKVKRPDSDPVQGRDGPLVRAWG